MTGEVKIISRTSRKINGKYYARVRYKIDDGKPLEILRCVENTLCVSPHDAELVFQFFGGLVGLRVVLLCEDDVLNIFPVLSYSFDGLLFGVGSRPGSQFCQVTFQVLADSAKQVPISDITCQKILESGAFKIVLIVLQADAGVSVLNIYLGQLIVDGMKSPNQMDLIGKHGDGQENQYSITEHNPCRDFHGLFETVRLHLVANRLYIHAEAARRFRLVVS